MKPPSNNRPGGGKTPYQPSGGKTPYRPSSGKTPYRPGGPRPATPRAQAPRDQSPRAPATTAAPAIPDAAAPRLQAAPRGQTTRVPERPVLTIATKGAFGRPEADAPQPHDGRQRDERQRDDSQRDDRPQAKRRYDKRPEQAPRPSLPRLDIDAPRGTLWLYGTHAIAAALGNPQRRLRRLLLTEEAETSLTAIAPKPWPIAAERTDRARLDLLLGRDTVHQGLALLADPLGSPSLVHALERPGPLLVLDQVGDPRNVGAILRSAVVFGAAAIIMQERNSPDESGALAKAASGALERIPLLRAVNIARTLVALKAAGCWVVGLDASGAPLSGPALSQRRVALVLGNEGEGLRRLTRDTCDELAGIPMGGSGGSAIDSLNVSAAATVALYELGRR